MRPQLIVALCRWLASVAVSPLALAGAAYRHSSAALRQSESAPPGAVASRPSSTLASPVHCQLDQSRWSSLALSVRPTRTACCTAVCLSVSTRSTKKYNCFGICGGLRMHISYFGQGANLVVMQIKQVRERAISHRCMMRMRSLGI